jgi:ribonuclease D
MTITLYQNDIPAGLDLGKVIAVDTEAMGLNNLRDRLCLVQLSSGDGSAHLVKFTGKSYDCPNLKSLLGNNEITKLFHFARFDISIIKHYLGVECSPLYCTHIASNIARTYTNKHSLRALCKEFLSMDLNKQQQCSNWGADELTQEQQQYAANDVLYLHKLKGHLDKMLEKEGRADMAQRIMDFVPTRADLDLAGWPHHDIFAHHSE